ncbi:MAG: hypothetical protein HN348_32770, partial [Proteobacteria bacterium]|nr:hypothetical protein [Pseudomonadota bacterium]
MTSLTAPSPTVLAVSSTDANNYAWNATIPGHGSGWYPAPVGVGVIGEWWEIDFASDKAVRSFGMTVGNANGQYMCQSANIEYWDGDSWELALAISPANTAAAQQWDIPDVGSHQKWRLYVTGGTYGGGSIPFCLVDVFFAEEALVWGSTNGFHLDFADASDLGKDAIRPTIVEVADGDRFSGSYKSYWGFPQDPATVDYTNVAGGTAIMCDTVFPGDFEVEATITGQGNLYFCVFPTAEDGTFASSNGNGNFPSMTYSFFTRGDDGNIYYGGASQGSSNIIDGEVVKIERVGSTLKLYRDGVLEHTWSQTYSGPMRLALANTDGGTGPSYMDDFTWTYTGDNSFTAVNLDSTDQFLDAPTPDPTNGVANYNVFSTLMRGSTYTGEIKDGGLVTTRAGNGHAGMISHLPIGPTGKWYAEAKVVVSHSSCGLGLCHVNSQYIFSSIGELHLGGTATGDYALKQTTGNTFHDNANV